MQVEEFPLTKVNIDDIQLDPTNPNKPTKEQIAAIKKSFERFGFLVPVILNENMQVGDGEHRILIYKQLGITEIPAYIVPKLNNDIERRLLRQTMNKLRGEHDIKLDADEIALIFQDNKLDNLAELIAQQRESLENILTKHKGIEFQHEDNFDVDKALEDLVPETQLGDIWQLGSHRIICADCSDERSIQRLMEDKKADLILTDPPYGIDLDTDWTEVKGKPGVKFDFSNIGGGGKYDKVIGDSEEFDPASVLSTFDYVKDIFMWGADYYCDKLPKEGSWFVWDKRVIEEADAMFGSHFELCWSKQKHRREIIRKKWAGVFGLGSQDTRSRVHPTQKPVEISCYFINKFSQEDNIIVDPFLGSGSTLIACEQTNRILYGVEIDRHYVDVCVKRWESYTGQKGQLISNTEKAAQ